MLIAVLPAELHGSWALVRESVVNVWNSLTVKMRCEGLTSIKSLPNPA